MEQKHGQRGIMSARVVPQMRELIATVAQACMPLLNPFQRRHCFELFGFDFLLTSDGHVFLIEVNTNPCLEESSLLLKRLIPRMISNAILNFGLLHHTTHTDDALSLTVDKIFEPVTSAVWRQQLSDELRVEPYSNDENLW